jgi:hypothetical protein
VHWQVLLGEIDRVYIPDGWSCFAHTHPISANPLPAGGLPISRVLLDHLWRLDLYASVPDVHHAHKHLGQTIFLPLRMIGRTAEGEPIIGNPARGAPASESLMLTLGRGRVVGSNGKWTNYPCEAILYETEFVLATAEGKVLWRATMQNTDVARLVGYVWEDLVWKIFYE